LPTKFTFSYEPLDKKDVSDKTPNILPGQPSRLQFRMQPAASLRVKLLDRGEAAGEHAHLADQRSGIFGRKNRCGENSREPADDADSIE
jgi:hypothetical protein